ncbi:hypothetical protein Dimus_027352 [Dionaea muscipula]
MAAKFFNEHNVMDAIGDQLFKDLTLYQGSFESLTFSTSTTGGSAPSTVSVHALLHSIPCRLAAEKDAMPLPITISSSVDEYLCRIANSDPAFEYHPLNSPRKVLSSR